MFKTFPEFSRLTIADRDEYESYIESYPPVSDISFALLMTWWNTTDNMAVALLNGNLVLSYWIPGDEKHSGLSLIGTRRVDESLCILFDYLRDKGDPVKLVNVPSFVLNRVQYPELFSFKEDRRYDEYVVPVVNYYPLENITVPKRIRIRRRLRALEPSEVIVKELDLTDSEDKKLLISLGDAWRHKNINNYGTHERDAMKIAIDEARQLGVHCISLFVDGELYGFCLFEYMLDEQYVTVIYVKATHQSSLGYELMLYKFAEWFSAKGVTYVNLGADMGLMRLRMFMLTIGPTNFFRKYAIYPA